MTNFSLYSPTTVDEALALLATATPMIDSPTQAQQFGAAHQRRAFERGYRKPEWVWAAIDSGGEPSASSLRGGRPNGPAPG